MKKMFTILLSFVFVFSLCACGNNNGAISETEPSNTSSVNTDDEKQMGVDDSNQEIIELLTSDAGEWGSFFREPGVSINYEYYRFYVDDTTGQLMFSWNKYDVSGQRQQHVHGYDGTATVTDTEIVLTHLRNGNDIRQSISYTYTDGVLELTLNGNIYHKDNWSENIMDEIFTNGWTGEMLVDVLNKGYVVDIE